MTTGRFKPIEPAGKNTGGQSVSPPPTPDSEGTPSPRGPGRLSLFTSPVRSPSPTLRCQTPTAATPEAQRTRSITAHRNSVRRMQPSQHEIFSDVSHHSVELMMLDGVSYHLDVFIHKKCKGYKKRPTTFYIPGTAFIARGEAFDLGLAQRFAHDSGNQVVIVSHRLAPEHPFPVPLNDCVAIMKTLCQLRQEYRIDLNEMSLLGYSSGGNLAPSVALELLTYGYKFKQMVLISPVMDFRFLADSDPKNNKVFTFQDPELPRWFLDWFMTLYCSNLPDKCIHGPDKVRDYLSNPLISPAVRAISDLRDLPPTLFVIPNRESGYLGAETFYRRQVQAGHPSFLSRVANGHGACWESRESVAIAAYFIQNLRAAPSRPLMSAIEIDFARVMELLYGRIQQLEQSEKVAEAFVDERRANSPVAFVAA